MVGTLGVAVLLIGPLVGAAALMVHYGRLKAKTIAVAHERWRLEAELRQLAADGGRLDCDAGRRPDDDPIWVPKSPCR